MQKFVIAFYIRLSLEDTKTESMSIPNHDVIYKGGFHPRKLHHDCGSFVTNWKSSCEERSKRHSPQTANRFITMKGACNEIII